jgi:hypothetical protein
MAMPPNSTGETDRWWAKWYVDHGRDNEAERGFLGYLSTRSLHPFSLSAAQLDTQWTNYLAYIATSAGA